ncbi:DUF3024 domain-containing protein [Paenibacillus thalictri]|uniref:DUF3024 domain-containing protein n=2 Tax=Paenibacillus thalictri TaxID=2527873 RepID=A0A4Q9DP66_9BACL|nr:DUF3024 domain-containing protein [Paenibacillus thalictri]
MDDFTKVRIIKIMDNYTQNKVPKHVQNQIKMTYKIRGNNITLVEERPAFRSDEWVQLAIAQFRLDQGKWKVYWRDSKEKWHYVEEIEPNENFEKQLNIVDKDNTGIFWG